MSNQTGKPATNHSDWTFSKLANMGKMSNRTDNGGVDPKARLEKVARKFCQKHNITATPQNIAAMTDMTMSELNRMRDGIQQRQSRVFSAVITKEQQLKKILG